MTEELKCSKCKEHKPTSEFYRNTDKRLTRKYNWMCKECRRQESLANHHANRDLRNSTRRAKWAKMSRLLKEEEAREAAANE